MVMTMRRWENVVRGAGGGAAGACADRAPYVPLCVHCFLDACDCCSSAFCACAVCCVLFSVSLLAVLLLLLLLIMIDVWGIAQAKNMRGEGGKGDVSLVITVLGLALPPNCTCMRAYCVCAKAPDSVRSVPHALPMSLFLCDELVFVVLGT